MVQSSTIFNRQEKLLVSYYFRKPTLGINHICMTQSYLLQEKFAKLAKAYKHATDSKVIPHLGLYPVYTLTFMYLSRLNVQFPLIKAKVATSGVLFSSYSKDISRMPMINVQELISYSLLPISKYSCSNSSVLMLELISIKSI